jgi:hypothetical protein
LNRTPAAILFAESQIATQSAGMFGKIKIKNKIKDIVKPNRFFKSNPLSVPKKHRQLCRKARPVDWQPS